MAYIEKHIDLPIKEAASRFENYVIISTVNGLTQKRWSTFLLWPQILDMKYIRIRAFYMLLLVGRIE